MYVFIDAKTYNLDVFQCLKCTNRYVFLAKKRKNIYVSFISLRYLYQCIFINKQFRLLDPLTYPQT